MPPIPTPLLVERDQEEIRPFQRLQHLLTVRLPGQRLADLGVELVKHRRGQQEALLRLGKRLQHLVLNKIQDSALTATKPVEKGGHIVASAQSEGRQLESSDPALRARLQETDL